VVGRGRDGGSGCPILILAAFQTLLGGSVLILASLLKEPIAALPWSDFVSLRAVGSLAYLVLVGSLLGFGLYLWLMRLWPPSRLASYAFLTPLIAVVLGWVVLGERLGIVEWAAGLLLLAGAYLSLVRKPV